MGAHRRDRGSRASLRGSGGCRTPFGTNACGSCSQTARAPPSSGTLFRSSFSVAFPDSPRWPCPYPRVQPFSPRSPPKGLGLVCLAGIIRSTFARLQPEKMTRRATAGGVHRKSLHNFDCPRPNEPHEDGGGRTTTGATSPLPSEGLGRGRLRGPGGSAMKRARPIALAVFGLAALSAPRAVADGPEEEKFADWAESIQGTQEQPGFLRLFRDEKKERLLAAIPSELLEKPFFLATSVAGGSNYAGWQWEDKLVRFERFRKQVLLVELNTRQRAAPDKPLGAVVRRTYADRLLASLDIISVDDEGALLVDLGRLLTRETRTFFGGVFSVDTSLVRFTKVKAFPQNVEVALQMPLLGDGTFVTLHYSISSLPPLKEYTPRLADDRIGYFYTAIRDYTQGDPREGRMVRYINRWHLQKADPSLPLSPPKEPIVFYVEKTVPIAFRSAVIAGIEEWNKAFEKIGIARAIDVRQQTETQFADLDPEDVRYNFFRWITSETPFAMGPSRVDPRNGRILDADIIFDDSMLRGYMRDYDALLREGPEKMLTRPMARLLERHPERHPLARLLQRDGASPRLQGVRAALRELAGEPGLGKLLADDWKVETEEDLRLLPKRLRAAAVCSVGEYLPHEVGLLRLAAGGGALRRGSAGSFGPFEQYLQEIVKETVMHEVGHTLGLRHNFQASSFYSLERINAKDRPPVLSASVMDYHPVNLGLDPERRGHYLTQRLGPYDLLAIEYGYAFLDGSAEADEDGGADEGQAGKNGKAEEAGAEGADEDEVVDEESNAEREALSAIARRMAEEGLPYATDEDLRSPDPSIAQWDLGDDPVAFARARLGLVLALWKDLEKRTVADDESYAKLRRALDITLFEVSLSSVQVARQVGGLYFSRDHRGDPKARPPIRVVPPERQRESLRWLAKNLFAADALPVPPELQNKLAASRWVDWGSDGSGATLEYPLLDRILEIQTWALFFLTSDDVIARVWENEQRSRAAGIDKPITIPELLSSLEAALFSELEGDMQGTPLRPAIGPRRQNLQDAYVRQLVSIALASDLAPPVATKQAWLRLKLLEERMQNALARCKDPYTRAHLEALITRSKAARTARYVHVASGVSGCSLAPAPSGPGLGELLIAAALCGLLALRMRSAA
ncbi:MAG: DUF5117 domain-containing protein [Planctomycetota bacterium]|nr:MAG: DUF5117 domain-containing protein [Planctomycetota bacterium]